MDGNYPFEIDQINPVYLTDTERLKQIEALFTELLEIFKNA